MIKIKVIHKIEEKKVSYIYVFIFINIIFIIVSLALSFIPIMFIMVLTKNEISSIFYYIILSFSLYFYFIIKTDLTLEEFYETKKIVKHEIVGK